MIPLDEAAELEAVDREALDWIARFACGDMSAADKAAMKAWLARSTAHAAAYGRARQLWQALGPVARDSMRARSVEPNAPRPLASRRAVLAGAGALAAAATGYAVIRPPLGLWPSLFELTADYRTAAGGRRQVTVADASLDLNSRTSIAVRRATETVDEIELITGEAVIAAGSRAVSVHAAGGRVVASQARFDLRCYGEAVVTCIDGEVQVERGSRTIALAARQQVSYGGQGIGRTRTIDPAVVTAWQQGWLIFEFTPVVDAVDEVNRYRSGRIVLLNHAIGQRVLNARFRIEEADKIVRQIVEIFGARATHLPGGVVLLT